MIERAAPQIAARCSRGDLYENLVCVHTQDCFTFFALVASVCYINREMREIYHSKLDIDAARAIYDEIINIFVIILTLIGKLLQEALHDPHSLFQDSPNFEISIIPCPRARKSQT